MMKSVLRKKFNFVAIFAAIFAVFAIFAFLSVGGEEKGGERVVFADEEGITLLETKAKVSLDEKYLLLITGFDPTELKGNGLYYIGYKYTVGGVETDTARIVGAEAAKYYASITLKTDLEDPSKTIVVTPEMIYGEGYENYSLIVYEIEFETSYSVNMKDYSDIYAYIDEVESDGNGGWSVVNSATGDTKNKYMLLNGDFETGDLTGWTVSNSDIGNVIQNSRYWSGIPFNQGGEHLFSAYTVNNGSGYAQDGNEGATGTLTSSVFTLGGSGWITFKLGAGKNYDQVYLEVLENGTNDVLARFYNSEWVEANDQGCALIQYRANLEEFLGRELYIRITDNATGDYGLFFVDDVMTYYPSAPSIGTVAKNILYNAVNGSFDKGLYGWAHSGDIGVVTSESTFWGDNAINNTDNYFRGDLNDNESHTGTLTSSDFIVSGSGFITFKLGAAGNEICYITVEKKTNSGYETVALWHNNLWVDGGEHAAESGYGLRMVAYKADLSDLLGETVHIVLHDEAASGFGFFTFDELKTYYDEEPNGTLIANQLIARANLLSVLAAEDIDAQGDYTSESYDEYAAKRAAAENLGAHSKIAAINAALSELASAKASLALRVPEEVGGANKALRIYAEGTLDVTISDYVDDNSLSGITYEVVSSDVAVDVGEIEDGELTLTAADISEETEVTVTIVVKYYGTVKLEVEIGVTVTKDQTPTLIANSVDEYLDLFELQNKTDIELDFTSNVQNLGNLELIYTVMKNEEELEHENNAYTFTYGSYTYEYTNVVFEVTVAFTANGNNSSIEYNYTLHICDTTDYRITNGDFETGDLTGWTLDNAALGNVIENSRYWDNIPFNQDGTHLFSAYTVNNGAGHAQDGNEGAKGTLTSSTFVVGGSGYITYKLGAAKNADGVWIDVVDNANGNILGRYSNSAWSNSACTLIPYKVDLLAHIGKTVYLRVVDNATSDYGLFFLDAVNTYYAEEPSNDFNATANITVNVPANIYQIYNGGFETGNFDGWVKSGDFVSISAQEYYWNNANCSYGKDGSYLISGVEDAGQANLEGNRGTLISAPFVVGGSGYITYKLGGGGNALCYIDIIDLSSGYTLARFHNDNLDEARMKLYKADLRAYLGKTVYIKIVDEAADSWGCLAADSFVTYCQVEPTVYDYVAADHKYEVINGSFESGLLGWTIDGDLGAVVNNERKEGWYTVNDDNKDGNNLFTFYPDGANKEGGRGYLQSSTFVLEENGIISFRLGAAFNADVYIELRSVDNTLLATFRNYAAVTDTYMVKYYYEFDNSEEITCYFKVVDNATSNYGCFVVDDFRANLDAVPEGAVIGSSAAKA